MADGTLVKARCLAGAGAASNNPTPLADNTDIAEAEAIAASIAQAAAAEPDGTARMPNPLDVADAKGEQLDHEAELLDAKAAVLEDVAAVISEGTVKAGVEGWTGERGGPAGGFPAQTQPGQDDELTQGNAKRPKLQ